MLQLLASRAAASALDSDPSRSLVPGQAAGEADPFSTSGSANGPHHSHGAGLGGRHASRAVIALDDELSALGLTGRRTDGAHRHGQSHGGAASKAGDAHHPSKAAVHAGSLRAAHANASGVRRSFAGTAMSPVLSKVRSMHSPRRAGNGSGSRNGSGSGSGSPAAHHEGGSRGSDAAEKRQAPASRRSGVGFGFGSVGASAGPATHAFSSATAAADFGVELTAAGSASHTANPLLVAHFAGSSAAAYGLGTGTGTGAVATASSGGSRASISPLHAPTSPASGRPSIARASMAGAPAAAHRGSVAPRASMASPHQHAPRARFSSSAHVAAAAAAAAAAANAAASSDVQHGQHMRGSPRAPGGAHL